MVDVNIERSWKNHLKRQFTAPYMVALLNFLKEEEVAGKETYPPSSKIFNAFNLTKFSSIKVIILGQDPYHAQVKPMDLAFRLSVL
jgi:uracil-DNA glycosylase